MRQISDLINGRQNHLVRLSAGMNNQVPKFLFLDHRKKQAGGDQYLLDIIVQFTANFLSFVFFCCNYSISDLLLLLQFFLFPADFPAVFFL